MKKKDRNPISDRLEKIGMSTNQLSNVTGIANSYLLSLQKNTIEKPGRDHLIRIGLALFMDMNELNGLLKHYKESEISRDDVTHFSNTIRKGKPRSGFNVLHQTGVNFETLIMSIEQMPGDVKIVTGSPYAICKDSKSYIPIYCATQGKEDTNTVNYIKEFLFEKRKTIFDECVKKNRIIHLICRKCLEEYIEHSLKNRTKNSIFHEFNTMFNYIHVTNYKVGLLRQCHTFDFQIKIPNSKKDKPIVIFRGKRTEHFVTQKREQHSLNGFYTDLSEIYQSFLNEFEQLESKLTEEGYDKKRLTKDIIGMLRTKKIKETFDIEERLDHHQSK